MDTQALLMRIKSLDVQIKHTTDIARRRAWILSRNKLVQQYNQALKLSADRAITAQVL